MRSPWSLRPSTLTENAIEALEMHLIIDYQAKGSLLENINFFKIISSSSLSRCSPCRCVGCVVLCFSCIQAMRAVCAWLSHSGRVHGCRRVYIVITRRSPMKSEVKNNNEMMLMMMKQTNEKRRRKKSIRVSETRGAHGQQRWTSGVKSERDALKSSETLMKRSRQRV